MTRGCYLPLPREIRDIANQTLRDFAAAGYGITVEAAIDQAKAIVAWRNSEEGRAYYGADQNA